MRKIHIKTFIILTFLSLYIGQGAFCDELKLKNMTIAQIQGVDVKNFKTFFKKKDDKNASPKEIKLEETELDTSTFSMFEDEDTSLIQEKTFQKKKSKFNFFKKNKKQDEIQDEIKNENVQQEQVFDELPASDIQDETYINDSEAVYIQEVEIFGNNLLDVNYIKEQIKSKEGYQYVRSDVSSD